MKKSRRLFLAAALLVPVLAGLGYAGTIAYGEFAERRLIQALNQGGYVIYLRHADRAAGNKEPFNAQSALADFADCTGQRNLTDEGRANARRIGVRFKELGIPVGSVFAIPLCRTRDTANLAFGKATLDPRFYDPAFVATLLGTAPEAGTNTVLVGSDYQAHALVGVDLGFGEAAVFQPDGKGGYRYLGVLDREDLVY